MENKQTAVEWLIKYIERENWSLPQDIEEIAKAMEERQMLGFAEFVATYRDKNKNLFGEMLHAKSKYDDAERTIDLLKIYYNETYEVEGEI